MHKQDKMFAFIEYMHNINFHAKNVFFASISLIWTSQIHEPNFAFLEALLCNISPCPIFSRGFSCKLRYSILNCLLNIISRILEKYTEVFRINYWK